MIHASRFIRVAALAAVALIGGCAIFQPLDDPPPDRLRLDWAQPLYPLEAFAYEPYEPGQALFVETDASASGGMVVVPSDDRRVRALDAHGGKLLWELVTKGPNIARPAVYEDTFVIGSMDGRVYRVNQRNGRPVWVSDYPGKGGVFATPEVHGGKIFVTSVDNRITVLDAKTGELAWTKDRPHATDFTITGQAGARVYGEAVLTGFSDGRLLAFAQSDGATLWNADLSGDKTDFVDVDSTPLVVGDVVVAASYSTGAYGVDAASGDVTWLVRGEGFGTPAEIEGQLYMPQANGHLWSINAETGAVQWVSRFTSEWATTPALTRKYVLAPNGDALLVLDRGTGRTLVRYDDSRGVSATPDVAYGTAYVQANSGTLYALGVY